jgi:hypothetical protein
MGEIKAYAVDCLLTGSIDVGVGRLSDQLETVLLKPLHEARLTDLGDGHVVEVAELPLEPDDLCAVVAGEPRGDPARRVHTKTARVKTEVGPYEVVGTVHGTVASQPLAQALRREGWIPLTDVVVMYRQADQTVSDDVEVLLVNRHLLRHFREADRPDPDDETALEDPAKS